LVRSTSMEEERPVVYERYRLRHDDADDCGGDG
jgi:hypothetical protein